MDITEKPKSPEKIISGNVNNKLLYKFFEATFKLAGFPIAIFEHKTNICVLVNDEFCKKTNITREQALGNSILDLTPGEKNLEMHKNYIQALDKKGTIEQTSTFILPDGKKTTGLMRSQIINVNATKYRISIARDLTELEVSKEKAERANKNLNMMFNSSPYPIFIQEINEEGIPGKILEINKIGYETLGYTKEECLDLNEKHFRGNLDQEKIAKIEMELKTHGRVKFDETVSKKDNSKLKVSVELILTNWNDKPAIMGFIKV